jgi:hypothetical protein
VKTIDCGWKPVNTLRSVSFKCTLAVGVYRFHVYATDTAGNPQSTVAWNTLTVH